MSDEFKKAVLSKLKSDYDITDVVGPVLPDPFSDLLDDASQFQPPKRLLDVADEDGPIQTFSLRDGFVELLEAMKEDVAELEGIGDFQCIGDCVHSTPKEERPLNLSASMFLTIHDVQIEANETATLKGWHDEERTIPELLCLVHSELSEALEDYRNGFPIQEIRIVSGKPEGLPIELADAVIRIADMCGAYGIDLAEAIMTKLEYNRTRDYRHGGKKV